MTIGMPKIDAAPVLPWDHPDWPRQVLGRLDGLLADRGITRTGTPVRVRHGRISSVLRVPSDQGPLWFKQVPELFQHEGRVVDWLAGLVPGLVPGVLATAPGWLLMTDVPQGKTQPHGHPLVALVDLQVSLLGGSEARQSGCPERGLDRLADDVGALCERDDMIDAADADRLRAELPTLDGLCRQVAALGVPETLVHGDLHPGNTLWSGRGWVLLDWTDACIGHPFIDMVHYLADADADGQRRVADIYRSAWQHLIPQDRVEVAVGSALALGAAHHAETHRRIIDAVGISDALRQDMTTWVRRLVTELRRWRGAPDDGVAR